MNRFPVHAFTAVLLASLASGGAQAVTNVTVQLGINPNFSGGTGPVNPVVTQAGPAELSSGLVTGGFNSTGTGHVYADIGVIKVDGTSSGSLNSVVRGIFRDDFKLDLPGMPMGTQLQINFDINLGGSMSVNDHNEAAAGWQVSVDAGGGAFDLGASGHLYNNSPVFGVHGYVGDAIGVLHGTAIVPTGQWLPLYVELTASAQTSWDNGGDTTPGASAFDFSHTLTWGGMTVLLNGVPQPGVQLSSGSGLNYLQAVAIPEPGTATLMVLGAAALLWRRRMS